MEHNLIEKAECLSDNELVSYVLSGNYEYLQTLINRYMPYIISVAAKYKSYGCDIDDLIQEGILSVFSAVKSYDSEKASFRTFVTLCINRSINDQLRAINAGKRIPENMITAIDEVILPDECNPENIFIEKESYNDLTVTLKKNLSGFEYKVFCEFLSGSSYSDIADKLNISVKSVDNALKRIRSKFKK